LALTAVIDTVDDEAAEACLTGLFLFLAVLWLQLTSLSVPVKKFAMLTLVVLLLSLFTRRHYDPAAESTSTGLPTGA
tara:strand:- start:277 stop:507 length:231 start_codon:yes stop_codon:yes gene_type:complete